MVVAERALPEMALPEAERVIYETNPLEEVICQVRFPRILKLETEAPSGFQERIRSDYPIYKRNQGLSLGGLPQSLAEIMSREFPSASTPRSHEFESRDGNWVLTLNPESLALTCKRYSRWEDFRSRLEDALATFLALYPSSFYVRLGLRYKNVIRRSRLGLSESSWSELLRPWILGAYSRPEMRDEVEHHYLQTMLRLADEQGHVIITSGTVRDLKAGEECYLIDADFFIEKQTECADAHDKLDLLNAQSDRFFHWCIEERLHHAFLPRPSLVES